MYIKHLKDSGLPDTSCLWVYPATRKRRLEIKFKENLSTMPE